MTWGGFSLLLVAVYAVQTGVLALVPLPGFDAFLVLAIVCALRMPRHDARLAGWIIGLVQDLASSDALGIHALTLGLTAVALTWFRERANTELWWVRIATAFLAAILPQYLYLIHLHYWSGRGQASPVELLAQAALTAILAAVAAAAILALPRLSWRRRRRSARI